MLLTYAADIGRGFVADDFGWIYYSRIDSLRTAATLLVDGTPGFYRPLVALSFGLNELLFQMRPMAYALTNLLMAAGIVAGILRMAAVLRIPPVAGVFGAGLWILNVHGISMALMWISGRTSLLTTLFAVYAAVAVLRHRAFLAGALTLAALLSKEEPLLLPLILAVWLWLDRMPAATIGRLTWPSFAALGVYLALRARTDAFTPATAPSFYQLSAAPEVLLPNALGYLDRSLTFTAAVLLLGFIGFGRTALRPTEAEWRTALKGVVWLVLGFGVTIMIPVRSSLYVVFPTIGSALIGMSIGAALWRSIVPARRRAAVAALMTLPILVLPIHWLRHQETKAQAILSTRLLNAIRTAAAAAPDATRLIVVDRHDSGPTAASAFGAELPHAVELVTGRKLAAEFVPQRLASTTAYPPGTLVLQVENGAVTSID